MNRLRAAFAAAVLAAVALAGAACTDAVARSEPAAGGVDPPSPAELASLISAWQDGLNSVQMRVRTLGLDADGAEQLDVDQTLMIDLRNGTVYTTSTGGSFFGEEIGTDIHVLMSRDGTYVTVAPEAGWFRIGDGIDIAAAAEEVKASGIEAALLTDPRLDFEFDAGVLDGRDVWIAKVTISPDLLDDPELRAALGSAAPGSGAEEWDTEDASQWFNGEVVTTLWIDPLTGAPLRGVTALEIAYGYAPISITAVADAIAWNVPFDFPEPAPLLDGDEADAIFERAIAGTVES